MRNRDAHRQGQLRNSSKPMSNNIFYIIGVIVVIVVVLKLVGLW